MTHHKKRTKTANKKFTKYSNSTEINDYEIIDTFCNGLVSINFKINKILLTRQPF